MLQSDWLRYILYTISHLFTISGFRLSTKCRHFLVISEVSVNHFETLLDKEGV